MDTQIQCWKRYFSESNAMFNFKEFCELFEKEKLDNKELENTKVVEFLKNLLLSDDTRIVHNLPKGTILYRCRKIPKNDILDVISYDKNKDLLYGFDCYGSKEPPITVSGEGRNNVKGASYLYLAENEYTACAEMKPDNFDILSVAKFIIKKDLKIFDLSVDDNFKEFDEPETLQSATILLSLIMSKFYIPVSSEREYLIPQYISDLIRKYGFDGVCYISSNTFCKNYTIFTCGDNYVEFIESELVRNHIVKYELYRINDSSKIDPQIHNKFELNPDEIEELKKVIIKKVDGKQWVN